MDKLQFLKFKWRYVTRRTSKNRNILINYLHLKFKSKADHQKIYQNYLSFAVLKNFCSERFVQIIMKTFAIHFIFSKIPCFQEILLGRRRQMRLKYENYYLRPILLQTTKASLEKLLMEVELKQKLQIRFKKTFLVVSRLDKRFGFDHSFFTYPIEKSDAQKEIWPTL